MPPEGLTLARPAQRSSITPTASGVAPGARPGGQAIRRAVGQLFQLNADRQVAAQKAQVATTVIQQVAQLERDLRASMPQQVRDLLAHVRDVMLAALAEGGTSFDALYVNVNGQSGYFDRRLAAYGQEGLPCPRCGRPIRRSAFMNRSSYFCGTCQRAPRGRPAPER